MLLLLYRAAKNSRQESPQVARVDIDRQDGFFRLRTATMIDLGQPSNHSKDGGQNEISTPYKDSISQLL